MAATGLHISISAEALTTIGGVPFTNSMLTSLIVSALLIGFALAVRLSLQNTSKPTGLQNFAEWIIESIDSLVASVAGSKKKASAFFPLVATFLLFILLNNWLGLVPGVGTIGMLHKEDGTKQVSFAPSTIILGSTVLAASTNTETNTSTTDAHETTSMVGEESAHDSSEVHETFVPFFRPGTADLNSTIALGFISILATQFFGVSYLSLSYFKKFINFSNPIMFFVGLLELVSDISKIISFAFRLFGNIFAGEVLLAVIIFLTSKFLWFVPVVPLPFYGLEVFVGFVQALVFAMLSLVFFNMATESHEEH